MFRTLSAWFNEGSRGPLQDKQSILGGQVFKTFNDSKTEVMVFGPVVLLMPPLWIWAPSSKT